MAQIPNDQYGRTNDGRTTETYVSKQTDNSAMGMVLGILLVVVIGVGAYYFISRENALNNVDGSTAAMEAPADTTTVAPSAGTPANDTGSAPAPSAMPAPATGTAE